MITKSYNIYYEISDLSGRIEEGDLGPVANPYRQVKYLVIRFSRYSSYTMDYLRLTTIGLYAGLVTTIPEPEEADGTTSCVVDKLEDKYQDASDWTANELETSIIPTWTGPWPELHIEVIKQLNSEVEVYIKSKVDLLGSVAVDDVDFKMKGLEELTEVEAASFITVANNKLQTNSLWVDVVHTTYLAVWVSFLVLACLAKLPFVISTSLIAVACLITIDLYVWYMWSIVFALRQSELTQEQVEWAFITASLSAFSVLFGAALVLHFMPLGIKKSLGYFSGGWERSDSIKGSQGRTTVLIFFTMIVLICITMLTFFGVTQNWW